MGVAPAAGWLEVKWEWLLSRWFLGQVAVAPAATTGGAMACARPSCG